MHTSLSDAIAGNAWSVAGVVRDLELILDDEGRPLSERRAPSVVKVGVPMVLKACPYPDERKGVEMNVSALAQITRYLDPVLAEIAGFRQASAIEPPRWEHVLAVILDQLAGPATFLLQKRDTKGPVPALRSVGHKLAAGFYGVVRGLLELDACGQGRPVTVSGLMGFVTERKFLVGASEACAGPRNMIENATAVLIDGQYESTTKIDRLRIQVAQTLAQQVALGLAWELFDRQQATLLVLREIGRENLHPRNFYVEQILDKHVAALSDDGDMSIDYAVLVDEEELQLRAMLGSDIVRDSPLQDEVMRLCELCAHDEGGIRMSQSQFHVVLARRAMHCLRVYQVLLSALVRKERALRALLGYDPNVPVKFETTVLPHSKTFKIVEAILGHRVECEPMLDPTVTVRNHRRSLEFPVSLHANT